MFGEGNGVSLLVPPSWNLPWMTVAFRARAAGHMAAQIAAPRGEGFIVGKGNALGFVKGRLSTPQYGSPGLAPGNCFFFKFGI